MTPEEFTWPLGRCLYPALRRLITAAGAAVAMFGALLLLAATARKGILPNGGRA